MTGTGRHSATLLRWACGWLGILVLALAAWLHAPASAEAQVGAGPGLEHAVALHGGDDAPDHAGACAASACLVCVAFEGEPLSFEPAILPAPPTLSVLLPEDRSVPPRRRPPRPG